MAGDIRPLEITIADPKSVARASLGQLTLLGSLVPDVIYQLISFNLVKSMARDIRPLESTITLTKSVARAALGQLADPFGVTWPGCNLTHNFFQSCKIDGSRH